MFDVWTVSRRQDGPTVRSTATVALCYVMVKNSGLVGEGRKLVGRCKRRGWDQESIVQVDVLRIPCAICHMS